jgi:hypothetical protein
MALPGVRLTAAETPESRGAGLAIAKGKTTEAIGELGNTVGSLAYHEYGRMQQEERSKANQVALIAASNKLDAWELKSLYDPQAGALQRKGSDSFTLPEAVNQDFEKVSSEIEQGLGNEDQKLAFARMKAQRGSNVQMTVARHVAGQRQAFDASEFDATVKNKSSLAIANAMDPRRAAEELNNGVTAIQQYGQRNGMGPEAISAQVNAFRSDTHIGIISNLLANEQTKAAQIYFEETKHDISGDKLDDVTRALHVGTTRKQAQDETAKILAAGGTLTEQRAAAKAIDDPAVQDEVLQRIEHEEGIRQAQARHTEESNLNTAYNIVTQTHDVNKIPAALLTQLGTHQPALRSYAESLSQGVPIKTNPQTLYDLLTLSSVNPDAFLKTNLMGHMGDVGKEDLEQLMRMQASMRGGGDKKTADGIFVSERAQNDIVDEALLKAGLVGSPTELRDPKNKALSDRIIGFRQSVRDAVNRQQQITGKHVTDDDMQGIVDRLMSPAGSRVSKQGWFSDTYTPIFVFETDDARRDAASIPPAVGRQIDDALRRQGLPVDDAHRVDTYQRWLKRGRE